MKGEFDDQLLWPFLGEITVQLVNQKQNRGHCENTIIINPRPEGYGSRFVVH